MEPHSYAEFTARLLYNELRYQINQSPSYIGLHLDPSKFFQAISYNSPSGERESINSWEFAPESRHGGESSVAKRVLRENVESRWKEHVDKTTRVVPYCFLKLMRSKKRVDGDVIMEDSGASAGSFC
jgi:hypothetical protein